MRNLSLSLILLLLFSACSSKYELEIEKIDKRPIEAPNHDSIVQDEEESK